MTLDQRQAIGDQVKSELEKNDFFMGMTLEEVADFFRGDDSFPACPHPGAAAHPQKKVEMSR